MRYHTILFDLDGTLTDPKEGLLNGVERAMSAVGLSTDDRESLVVFIGPPAQVAFADHLGLREPSLSVAVATYREYVRERGVYENALIGGIPELLDTLRDAGVRLAVATSKPTPTAQVVLDHFGLAQYFEFVGGADYDNDRLHKRDVIEHTLDELGLETADGVVMIGDREHDVIGAKHFGMDSIGVLWGYGPRTELEEAEAGLIVETVDELRDALLSPP